MYLQYSIYMPGLYKSTFRLIKTVYDLVIWIYEYISTEVELLCSVTQFVKTNTVFKDTSVIGGID